MAKSLSNEIKRRISKGLKGNKNAVGKKTEETKQKMRESRIVYMSSGKVKKKDTSIEIAIEQELKKQNIPYMKQAPIEGIALVDFLLPNKIIIQCDGNYWHNLPANKNRDINQDFILNFKVIKSLGLQRPRLKSQQRGVF